MLIYQTNFGARPIQSGITCKLNGTSINLPTIDVPKDFCYCKYGCEGYFKVFFGDKFTLFSQIEVTHTVSFLVDGQPLQNGVHGELISYDTNTKVFYVDWQQVGAGKHKLAIVQSFLGTTRTIEYGEFHVIPLLATSQDGVILADGTVKIVTYSNGFDEKGFYYKDFNIRREYRLDGAVQNEVIVSELTTNPNSIRERVQVQDREWSEYDVIFLGMNEQTAKELQKELLMADLIEVTDYNIMNQNYNNLKLRKKSIEMPKISYLETVLVLKAEDYETPRIKEGRS